MKLNSKLIILILLISNFNFAQVQPNDFKSIVTFSTFSPLVSYAPRWNLGYIRKVDKRYWVGLELGYGSKNISVNFAEDGGWIENDYKLFEIRPEFYYDLRPKSKLKHLLSLELFYINHSDKFKNERYFNIENNTYYNYDTANYKRIKYGMNINHSLIYNITTKLALLQKVGVGIRHRDVKYSNVVNEMEDLNYEGPNSFVFPVNDGFLRNEGKATAFNFNLDLKIIYKF